MREPLTQDLLLDLIRQLHVAFPRNLGKQNPSMMVDVYQNGLRGCSGNAVREAVGRLIQTETYFPKVAQIREAATAWERSHSVDMTRPREWGECPICGARVTTHQVALPYIDKDGKDQVYVAERGELVHDPRAHHIRETSDAGTP